MPVALRECSSMPLTILEAADRAVGRILQKGINFRIGDPSSIFPMTGIYFLQTSVDNKTVRVEKMMISK